MIGQGKGEAEKMAIFVCKKGVQKGQNIQPVPHV